MNTLIKKILIMCISTVVVSMALAQNDTMFVFKNGIAVGKYKVTDIDSITFHQPTATSPTDSMEIESIQFMEMAIRAANFIDANLRIPSIIYTDAGQSRSVNAAEFYYMMTRWLRWIKINGEGATPLPPVKIIRGITKSPSPSGIASGQFTKEQMLDRGKANADFIDQNRYVPNFTTVNAVQYSTISFFYAMAKTIRWYAQNSNTFPANTTLVEIAPPLDWSTSPPPDAWNKTLNVPYYDQPDAYTCGPTSLKMLMEYYNTTKTIQEISNYMASIGDSPYYDGVGPNTIISAAKYYDFGTTVTQYGWDNLKSAIAADHPVIANIQISANNYPRYYESNNPAYTGYNGGHYVVVVGLEANTDGSVKCVVVNDPSRGNVKYTTSSFETSWVNNKNRLLIRIK